VVKPQGDKIMKAIIEALEFVEMRNVLTGVALGLPMVAVLAIVF
jgi:hypothetical protein